MQPGSEYWDLFFDEVDSHLESLTQQLSELGKAPKNPEIIKEIFRIVHTVKGMASTIGFNSVAKLCHKMEEIFDYYRKNSVPVKASTIQLQIKSADSLFKIVEYISSNGEELQICSTLSEAICKELDKELKSFINCDKETAPPEKNQDKEKTEDTQKIQEKAKENKEVSPSGTGEEKEIKIKIKFSPDCTMPGVRAFMTAQVLEKNGFLIESDPPKEQFLDNMEIVSHGLIASVKSTKSANQLKDRLLKICDVIDVEAEEVKIENFSFDSEQPPKSNDKTETEGTDRNRTLDLDPQSIIRKFSEKEKEEFNNRILKAYHVDLSLSEEVQRPEEQFYNLLSNLNDYVGHIVDSNPSIKELKEIKDIAKPLPSLSSLIESESAQIDHALAKARRRIQFILLINGSHKSVLDYLSDACELNQVEVKEIKIGAEEDSPQDKSLETISGADTSEENSKAVSEPVQKHSDVKTTFVRVNLATLEHLMNAVGELVINHNRIKIAIGENPSSEITSTTQYLHQVTTKIQQLVMSIRMVPVNQVFSRFPRFIRDISRELNKEVNLELEGEQTEIDRIMVDELNEIFIHLVRNAIDHGLETSEERQKAGKPIAGLLKMQAYSQGNNVFVTISDDGKGIDPKKIKQKAVQKKLITLEQANELSEEEILNLIFATGFSTAEQVSDLSGRGVGMDIVKSKIASLGGQVILSSKLGEGTSFKLSIPSTISIIQALLINSSGLYAIPLSEIREIVTITQKNLYKLGPCDIMMLHDETVPLINLNRYLSNDDETVSHEEIVQNNYLVVIVESEGKPYGMIVQSLVGQQEIVIKPISNKANQHGLVNGATVFGDGRIAMILNVDRIVKMYLFDHSGFESSFEDDL
ncbi:MAG: chemotaxis protein CheA [Candidatus Caenarcaniphilales bacterium]|nr:chemotaxis protein CheA [Candidatus Caenarcaniphilales bacterium]